LIRLGCPVPARVAQPDPFQCTEFRAGVAAWIEENIPQGLVVHAFPKPHQKRLRTTNPLERINQELKRRTRVARVFPNEASFLRLVSALLAEISEEWETGKLYLNMAPSNPQAN
jgi:transposase-like protein